MKRLHILGISLLGITATAVGMGIAQSSYVEHPQNALGNDGKGSYSMTLNSASNTLFKGGYEAGTASTLTSSGQASVGFRAYEFNNADRSKMSSRGADKFTLTGVYNGVHMLFGNVDPFYKITAITVTYDHDGDNGLYSFNLYGSDEPITSIPGSAATNLKDKSGVRQTSPFSDNEYSYFALSLSGHSAHGDQAYHVGISSIYIEYTC